MALKNTYYCQRYVKIDVYNTYVRPILDYAAFVWSPHTTNSINNLESIQRRAARYVMSDYNRYIVKKQIVDTTPIGVSYDTA